MRGMGRGTILGIFFTFICSIMYSYDDRRDYTCISVTNNQSVKQQQNQSGFTYSARVGSLSYPQSFSQPTSLQAAVVAAYYNRLAKQVKDDSFCRKHYKISSRDVKQLYKIDYSEIVSKLMSFNLSDDDTCDLWYLYTEHCWNDDKVDACEKDLVKRLKQRSEREAQQELAQAHQRRLQEERNTQRKHYEKVYACNVLDLSDEDSLYKNERQLALQQTEQEGYKQHQVSYEFDEQVTGLMQSKGINPQQFQNLSGTVFQHQLFGEVATYYKKAAKTVYEYQFDNGLFVPSILQFGQCALRATSLEQFGLAIQLNDLSDCMAETSLSMCKGAIGSACNLVELAETGCSLLAYCVESPTALSEKLYTLLGRVINTVGNGVSAIASNEDGWALYVDSLEKHYQLSKQYAQEVVGQFKKWYKQTTLQDKVELGSQVVFDALLFSMAGKACSGIMSQIPEIRFLEGFADISAEYGLATEFGEVGLTSLEDVSKSLLKSEVDSLTKNGVKTGSRIAAGSKKRIYKDAPYHHKNSRGGSMGGKSRSPKDGQKVLDNSIHFKTKGSQRYERRLGVEEDYFVIFDEQRPGEFHGHICTWEELDKDGKMQKALYNAGIIKNIKTGKM